MTYITSTAQKIIKGESISREEALHLYEQPLTELTETADEIRRHFCGNNFDLCAIISGKIGRCSENCKFCAQSVDSDTKLTTYSLLSAEKITAAAKTCETKSIPRYSIVTSGKKLSEKEINAACEAIQKIKAETNLSVCVSFGLLNINQYEKLKNAGVTRIHNNLETSRRYFPHICTSHTYDDKIKAIHAAQAAGLEVCSGGIMGIGETATDRIDMAFTLRELHIKSIPINMLNPISGTPMANRPVMTEDELCRIVAVYRFILPDAFLRLAGGRGLLKDMGKSCFQCGANAAISGDMLTTTGITAKNDHAIINELGYQIIGFNQ